MPTCDVRADVSHLKKRSHMVSVDMNGLLLVAAWVDKDLHIPGTAAEPCKHTRIHPQWAPPSAKISVSCCIYVHVCKSQSGQIASNCPRLEPFCLWRCDEKIPSHESRLKSSLLHYCDSKKLNVTKCKFIVNRWGVTNIFVKYFSYQILCPDSSYHVGRRSYCGRVRTCWRTNTGSNPSFFYYCR